MQALRQYFASFNFSEEELKMITDSFSQKHYSKGQFFVEEGKSNKYLGFVEKGFLQYFIILDGVEKTTYSTGENNFAVSLMSFLRQVPAKENIRAIVETDLWLIERGQLKRLQQEIPSFKTFYVELLEWQICCIDESRLDAIMLNAQQRYEKMMEKEPNLIQQVPLQYLASILGVTPRHLSRIRNKIR